jgi:hypothetical protein
VVENQRGIAREVIKKLLNEFGNERHEQKGVSSFIEKA